MTEFHPLTFEPTNRQRAEWARVGVDAFARETYCGRSFTEEHTPGEDDSASDAYTMLQDLITDILHLADQCGWPASDLLRRADDMYRQEVLIENEAAQ